MAWSRPFLREAQKVEQIIDPKLQGVYSREGAKNVAILAYQCLSQKAKSRPRMSSVVKTLETILDSPDAGSMPFVYIVPKQGEKKSEEQIKLEKCGKDEAEADQNNEKEGDNKDGSKEIRKQKCPKGLRHKHRLNQFSSLAVSENKFYITLQTGINCNKSVDPMNQ